MARVLPVAAGSICHHALSAMYGSATQTRPYRLSAQRLWMSSTRPSWWSSLSLPHLRVRLFPVIRAASRMRWLPQRSRRQ